MKKSNNIIIGEGISRPFLVGSAYFFYDYADYKPKDFDYVCIVDKPIMFKTVMNLRGTNGTNKDDIYYWRRMTPNEYMEYSIHSDTPMQSIKFLSSDLCSYLGITINDIKLLKDVFDNMDKKHRYAKIIYDAYIKNGDFTLSQEQLDMAYAQYIEDRNDS